jgi:hypothetical protein
MRLDLGLHGRHDIRAAEIDFRGRFQLLLGHNQ